MRHVSNTLPFRHRRAQFGFTRQLPHGSRAGWHLDAALAKPLATPEHAEATAAPCIGCNAANGRCDAQASYPPHAVMCELLPPSVMGPCKGCQLDVCPAHCVRKEQTAVERAFALQLLCTVNGALTRPVQSILINEIWPQRVDVLNKYANAQPTTVQGLKIPTINKRLVPNNTGCVSISLDADGHVAWTQCGEHAPGAHSVPDFIKSKLAVSIPANTSPMAARADRLAEPVADPNAANRALADAQAASQRVAQAKDAAAAAAAQTATATQLYLDLRSSKAAADAAACALGAEEAASYWLAETEQLARLFPGPEQDSMVLTARSEQIAAQQKATMLTHNCELLNQLSNNNGAQAPLPARPLLGVGSPNGTLTADTLARAGKMLLLRNALGGVPGSQPKSVSTLLPIAFCALQKSVTKQTMTITTNEPTVPLMEIPENLDTLLRLKFQEFLNLATSMGAAELLPKPFLQPEFFAATFRGFVRYVQAQCARLATENPTGNIQRANLLEIAKSVDTLLQYVIDQAVIHHEAVLSNDPIWAETYRRLEPRIIEPRNNHEQPQKKLKQREPLPARVQAAASAQANQPQQAVAQPALPRAEQPCNLWNGPRGCTDPCRHGRRHACNNCRADGHTAAACVAPRAP